MRNHPMNHANHLLPDGSLGHEWRPGYCPDCHAQTAWTCPCGATEPAAPHYEGCERGEEERY